MRYVRLPSFMTDIIFFTFTYFAQDFYAYMGGPKKTGFSLKKKDLFTFHTKNT